jgi:hypothetical protein
MQNILVLVLLLAALGCGVCTKTKHMSGFGFGFGFGTHPYRSLISLEDRTTVDTGTVGPDLFPCTDRRLSPHDRTSARLQSKAKPARPAAPCHHAKQANLIVVLV